MSEVAAIEARVDRIENKITSGLERIENLLRQEITDLKKEQIDDLKKLIERLADDQRRMWEKLFEMERRENRRVGEHGGQNRVLSALWHFLSAAGGGFITWLATFLSNGTPPP